MAFKYATCAQNLASRIGAKCDLACSSWNYSTDSNEHPGIINILLVYIIGRYYWYLYIVGIYYWYSLPTGIYIGIYILVYIIGIYYWISV